MSDNLLKIQQQVIACTRCPRLIDHCRRIAQEKRRAYRDWQYWGKPVPGFGDPKARLLILGLAPAAHEFGPTGMRGRDVERIELRGLSGPWQVTALSGRSILSQRRGRRGIPTRG